MGNMKGNCNEVSKAKANRGGGYARLSVGVTAVGLLTLFSNSVLWAAQQPRRPPSDAETVAACGACGAGAGMLVLVPVLLFAINIALLVWVARDAKARNMDNAALWLALVLFTGPIGLIVYFFSRTQGSVVACESCGNKRLRGSARCPSCGNP